MGYFHGHSFPPRDGPWENPHSTATSGDSLTSYLPSSQGDGTWASVPIHTNKAMSRRVLRWTALTELCVFERGAMEKIGWGYFYRSGTKASSTLRSGQLGHNK